MVAGIGWGAGMLCIIYYHINNHLLPWHSFFFSHPHQPHHLLLHSNRTSCSCSVHDAPCTMKISHYQQPSSEKMGNGAQEWLSAAILRENGKWCPRMMNHKHLLEPSSSTTRCSYNVRITATADLSGYHEWQLVKHTFSVTMGAQFAQPQHQTILHH